MAKESVYSDKTVRYYYILYLFRLTGVDPVKKFRFESYSTSKLVIKQTLRNWKHAAEDTEDAVIIEDVDYKIVTVRTNDKNIDEVINRTENRLNKVDTSKKFPCWAVYDLTGFNKRILKFSDSSLAFDHCALWFAKRHKLPEGKYHLQWEVVLKDEEGLTRVYQDQSGTYRIVIEDYGS